MVREVKNDLGKIVVSEEVVATMAGMAATECYGVVGMASRRVTDGLAELLGRENLSKGVEVTIDGNRAAITLHIIVGYGVRISEVAKNVRERVKYTVESFTGLKVTSIKINVQGVRVGRDK